VKLKKVILIVIIIFIFSVPKIYAKYVLEYSMVIANLDIERDINNPQIMVINIENTNIDNPKIGSEKDIITIILNLKGYDMLKQKLKKEDIIVKLDNNNTEFNIISFFMIDKSLNETQVIIKIGEIKGNGKLKIQIPKGSIKDIKGKGNKEFEYDTEIDIDNTNLATNYEQTNIQNENEIIELIKNNKV